MSPKKILVTGASSGLGALMSRELIDRGHDVVVHTRRAENLDPSLAADAAHVLEADLALSSAVTTLADRANSFGRFDAVIHNAGVYRGPEIVPVSVLAPYILTCLMTMPERIIVSSSSMHAGGSALVDTTTMLNASYSTAKLYETALAFEVAERYPGVLSHAVDPGWVPTRMGGPGAPDDLTAGHKTQQFLATADPDRICARGPLTGGYWHHMRPQRPAHPVHDTEFRARLIEALEKLTGLHLPVD